MNEALLPAYRRWLHVLDQAEADLAAGRVVDGTAGRQRLRDSIARMKGDAERPEPKLAAGLEAVPPSRR